MLDTSTNYTEKFENKYPPVYIDTGGKREYGYLIFNDTIENCSLVYIPDLKDGHDGQTSAEFRQTYNLNPYSFWWFFLKDVKYVQLYDLSFI